MAGIGFELKKAFHGGSSLTSLVIGYGYAGIVLTGPMLLGVLLLLGIRLIGIYSGVHESDLRLLNAMVTYTLVASLLITGLFSMVTTRQTADAFYAGRETEIMPSFIGSVSVMMVAGGILYGIFLAFAGISVTKVMLCWFYFEELIMVWSEMNYLNAVRDYRGILVIFAAAVGLALVSGRLLLQVVTADHRADWLFFCVVMAYGIMAALYYGVLARYFPKGRGSCLLFLKEYDRYPALGPLGFFMGVGLYGHLIIMWASPAHHHIQGLFYETPDYDIPALFAFLSILITTISFVTGVETEFYPAYRNYFSLLNDQGDLRDLDQAEHEMTSVLYRELAYTFTKQFFTTVLFILLGTFLLPYLPLGFTEDMLGIYRILCVAYAFYAIGNCLMLIILYFADNRDALICGAVFMVTSCAVTMVTAEMPSKMYGTGFLAGGMAFTAVSYILLVLYLRKLLPHILHSQPIVVREKRGILTKIGEAFDRKARRKETENRMQG